MCVNFHASGGLISVLMVNYDLLCEIIIYCFKCNYHPLDEVLTVLSVSYHPCNEIIRVLSVNDYSLLWSNLCAECEL